jgi:hypothetical protein
MHRLKAASVTGLVSFVATVAIFGLTADTSHAFVLSSPCSGTEHWQLCVEKEGLKLVGGEALFAGEKDEGASVLKVHEGPEVTCENSLIAGNFLGSSGSDVVFKGTKLSFFGCKVLNAEATCEVPEKMPAIATKELTGSVDASVGADDITFKPSLGTTIAEFSIKAKVGKTCAFAVTNGKVSGSQLCELTEATTAVADHLLKCFETGSTLEFAGKKATFTQSELVELKETGLAGAAWSIQLDNG